MGVMRFCFWWSCTMGAGWAGCPGDCVCGGITGEAAGGTAGGAGEGRPVGWGGISFCGVLVGAAALAMGPGGGGGEKKRGDVKRLRFPPGVSGKFSGERTRRLFPTPRRWLTVSERLGRCRGAPGSTGSAVPGSHPGISALVAPGFPTASLC